MLGEDAQVLGVRGRVAAAQRLPRGPVAVVLRDDVAPVALVGVGEGEGVGAEGRRALRLRAVAAPGDDERDTPVGVAQAQVQRGEAAHRVADDDGPVQPRASSTATASATARPWW